MFVQTKEYTACPQCSHKIVKIASGKYECPKCMVKYDTPDYRYSSFYGTGSHLLASYFHYS